MVTKLHRFDLLKILCLILAKNHMVTKLGSALVSLIPCLILAKNHMVTKREDI